MISKLIKVTNGKSHTTITLLDHTIKERPNRIHNMMPGPKHFMIMVLISSLNVIATSSNGHGQYVLQKKRAATMDLSEMMRMGLHS